MAHSNLTSNGTECTTSLIAKLTRNFTLLEPEFVGRLMVRIYNRGYAVKGILPAPLNRDIACRVIGSGGKYLRLTTEKCQIDFIWQDNTSNTFIFFGDHAGVTKAMNVINHRIKICSERSERHEKADEQPLVADEQPLVADEQPLVADETKYDCFNCLKHSDTPLKKCDNCKVARYCDRECQKSHWKNHIRVCQRHVD